MSDSQQTTVDARVGALEPSPPQFGIRVLMVIVTIFAVCFCLLQNLGIVGALVLFAVACLFSIYARRRGRTTNTEMMFDLIWGIVLPVLCLTFDPVLFQPDASLALSQSLPSPDRYVLSAFALFGYLVLGLQMIVLLVWIMFGHALGRIAGPIAGILWIGFAIAFITALSIPIGAVAAAIAMFDSVGEMYEKMSWLGPKLFIAILGITPWFTARAFYRRAKQATNAAEEHERPIGSRLTFTCGAAFAAILPLGILALAKGQDALAELFPYLF